jgi:drug/metabolite transporter (DMT)-like permease
MRSRVLLQVLVFGAVALNLLNAVFMKTLANQVGLGAFLLLLGMAAVLFVNGLRMLVWMYANRYFPLSTMYPLTSIYYPLMLFVSHAFGETITLPQVIGALLIAFGVFWLGRTVPDEVL